MAYFRAFAGVNVISIENDIVVVVGVNHAADVVVRSGRPLYADEADVIANHNAVIGFCHDDCQEFGGASGGLRKLGTAR